MKGRALVPALPRRPSVASRVAGAVAAAWILVAIPAAAAPIDAHVAGCVGDSCMAAPDGGPISVDTMDWVSVSFFPATSTVPEPEVVALIAIAVIAVLVRQIRKLRRVRPARLE